MTARLLLAASFLALAAPLAAQAPTPGIAVADSPSARLKALFAASDEANLQRNPLNALFRGDLRYADRYGDYVTDAYYAAEKAAAQADLAALARIDRAQLPAEDQISYDTFKWQTQTNLAFYEPALMAVSIVRPIDHFNAPHGFFADLSSGESVAPYKTLKDYEDGLKRIDDFAVYYDRVIGRFREGAKAGVTQPRLVVENLIGQLDTLLGQGVAGSAFMKPVGRFPAGIGAADQARLKAAYADKLQTVLFPVLTRVRDYLKTDYLPKARASVGLGEMPGGAALYRFLVKVNTTTDLTPEAIHEIGLKEVARITRAMDAEKAKIGFKGPLPAFFAEVRTNPSYKAASKQDLGDRYRAVEQKLEATLPKLFSTIPKSPLEIRPVPEFLEKNQAGAYYQPGTPDGSRPGVFYYNTYDLPSRTTEGVESLFLHEANPGHHFQISLAQENTDLPAFQRFGGNTAYVEGWALYAESLGRELGLYTDPVQQYGNYDSEIFRAIRLVVDTGIHSKGWGRDKAIAYMMANSATSKTDATSEIERYIAIPAQALAYKIGQLEIRRLRTKAEAALGPKFDVRDFHAQVLMSGALPLEVLEAKIDRWIAGRRA